MELFEGLPPDAPYPPGTEPVWLLNLTATRQDAPDGVCRVCGGWTFLNWNGRMACPDCGHEATP